MRIIHAVGLATCSFTLQFTLLFIIMCVLSYKSCAAFAEGPKLSHCRWCAFEIHIWNIYWLSSHYLFTYKIFHLYADEGEQLTHGTLALHLYVRMLMRLCFCDLPEASVNARQCVFVPMCTSVRGTCVCAWILQLGESVHVHYIRQSVWGVPQHVCTAVCSELSAPAGSAIPIYPSAAEVGGKSAGHRCRRFHIRGTRLPVRGPLCRGDEGGRLQGYGVGELGLLGDGGVVRGGRAARLCATLESVSSLFSGEHSCQAAHLFDTRRCGMAVRGRLSWFTSLRSLVYSKALDNRWSSVVLNILAKLCVVQLLEKEKPQTKGRSILTLVTANYSSSCLFFSSSFYLL